MTTTDIKKKVYTGGLHPRDYGIEIPLGPGKLPLFASPARYALGAIALDKPSELKERIRSYARTHDLPASSLVRDFAAKWEKYTGQDPFDANGQGLIAGMERYRRTVFSRVASRSGEPGDSHGADLTITGSPSGLWFYAGDCACDDFRYSKPKGLDLRCAHLATSELALAADVRGRVATERSRSRLLPRQRPDVTVPIHMTPERALPLVLDYLLGNDSLWRISQAAVDEKGVLAEEIVDLFLRDGAQFSVMLQGGEFRRPSTLSATERRVYGATSEVRRDTRRWLRANQFVREGYSLAFQGTDAQRVAERWREGNRVYEMVTIDRLPVLMGKNLGDRVGPWQHSVASEEGLFLGTRRYVSIDDATRRKCEVSVYLPQELSAARPAQVLAKAYSKLDGIVVSETR